MKNLVPNLRQRSDSFWEIVCTDLATGMPQCRKTGTKDQAKAEKKLEGFKPTSADAPDSDAPRLRCRKDSSA